MAGLSSALAPYYNTRGARAGGATKHGFFELSIHFVRGEKNALNSAATVTVVGGARATRSYTLRAHISVHEEREKNACE